MSNIFATVRRMDETLNTLTVLAGVFDHNGNYVTASQKSIDISLTDQRLDTMPASGVTVKSTLDVPPGGYVVRLVVRDSEGQLMSAQNSAGGDSIKCVKISDGPGGKLLREVHS